MPPKKASIITVIATIIAITSPFVIAGWKLIYEPIEARVCELEQKCGEGEKSRQMIMEILILIAREVGVDPGVIIERER